MTTFTEELIKASVTKFVARRGEKFVHAGGKGMRVHTPGQRVLHLPNGAKVLITVDDSGVATQVIEDEAQHAIVRPKPISMRNHPLVPGGHR